ncbi:MAG: DJ-1/PfpI family protein [Myxococcales bacterium]|nr:DJ-1/PfpI family protein [Myxococcales bacterium]MCB9568528.1 DJ-1/PfpI family protein [Myxococcales bacterium]MCB9701987.1 DJ-1/PfpI family protein [Myxococcales bacterium]
MREDEPIRLPRALMLVPEGAEEMEVTIVVDVLRRGGVDVVMACLNGGEPVRCSRGVHISPDTRFVDIEGDFDVVVLPGGAEGVRRLCASADVGELLRRREAKGELVAAICAAPLALRHHKVFADRTMTCHPSVESRVMEHGRRGEGAVVVDGNLITSRGPGTTFAFALAILARLRGEGIAHDVEKPLMLAG